MKDSGMSQIIQNELPKKLSKFKSVLNFLKDNLPLFICIAVVIFVIICYTNHVYKLSQDQADQKYAKMQAAAQKQQADMHELLNKAVIQIDQDITKKFDKIDTVTAASKTTVVKEVAKNPRLSDPNQGITDDMLTAINNARKETQQ